MVIVNKFSERGAYLQKQNLPVSIPFVTFDFFPLPLDSQLPSLN
jgi:hypothetical protein